MKNPEHNLVLHCHLCGAEVGTAYSSLTEAEYRLSQGIVDQRCTDCNQTHGTFRELLEEYKEKTGDDEGKAEAFVKVNRKRTDFDKELEKELKKRDKIKQ